jgi:UDP-2,4-diacetamido-2,4,6-trideoxy-beta-L-altropyranose hydrolase
MNICIRADASVEIGSGHVMRCLTLAAALRERGAVVQFVCREFPGNLCATIEQQGFAVHTLPRPSEQEGGKLTAASLYERWLGVSWERDAQETAAVCQRFALDWLVVDHYGIDARWHKCLRPFVRNILCIDDLANRPLECDLMLDQNLYDNAKERYTPYLAPHTITLLEPKYALLREEFRQKRDIAQQKNHQKARQHQQDRKIHQIFVFFGGSDPSNVTAHAVRALQSLVYEGVALQADIVVGIANPHKDQIAALCKTMPQTQFHCHVPNMADLMLRADLALGAGGSTTWERCCLGVPTLAVIIAENQREMTETAARHGIQHNMGWHEDLTVEQIADTVREYLSKPDTLRQMSANAQKLVDGYGTQRVVEAMIHQSITTHILTDTRKYPNKHYG